MISPRHVAYFFTIKSLFYLEFVRSYFIFFCIANKLPHYHLLKVHLFATVLRRHLYMPSFHTLLMCQYPTLNYWGFVICFFICFIYFFRCKYRRLLYYLNRIDFSKEQQNVYAIKKKKINLTTSTFKSFLS